MCILKLKSQTLPPFRFYSYTSFYCPSVPYALQIMHFSLETEGLWPPCIEQVNQCHLPNNICSVHVSGSQFGNSNNIPNAFVSVTLVMVLCDHWPLVSLLELSGATMNHTHKDGRHNESWVRSDCSVNPVFPRLSPSAQDSLFPKTQ